MQLGAIGISKTNIICAIGNDSGEIISQSTFDICSFKEAINIIVNYFKSKHIKGLGIGLCETFQDDWSSLKDELNKELKCTIALDTYANACILGEANFGSCKGLTDCVYMTSDNIIEIGIIQDGKLIKSITETQDKEVVQNLSQSISKIIMDYSPQKIVIQTYDNNLLDLIQKYISITHSEIDNSDYVTIPNLKSEAVIKGAIVLIRKVI